MSLGRRRFLFGSIGVGTALQWARSVTANAAPTGEIVFENQTTDGTKIIVEKIATDRDGGIGVIHEDADEGLIAPSEHPIEAGFEAADYEIEINPPMSEGGELSVSLYDEDGSGFARDTAVVTLEDPVEIYEQVGPTRIEADEDAGFNFPYFLYAPRARTDQEPKPLLVEPNNSPSPSDDFDVHLEAAESILTHSSGRRIADELAAPFMVPAFGRPNDEIKANPQGMHRRNFVGDETERVRPDLQLIAMAEHAREYLREHGYPIDEDGMMLNGFSGSANTINLFTALHPDEVRSVSAGGINGIPVLPIEEANGYRLTYHAGITDLAELIDKPFDREAFADVNQFYYMGELDDSDQLPFYPNEELFEKTKHVYGRHMVQDRFPYARSVYEDEDVNAIFRVYEDVGHDPQPAHQDLVEFHERSLADENINAIRNDIGGNVPELGPHIEFAPNSPTVGDEITFDARRSSILDGEIESFEWKFTEKKKDGIEVTHSFNQQGGHNVVLTATDGEGAVYRAVKQVLVRDPDPEHSNGQDAESVEPSLSFTDQESDGTSIVLDEVTTDVDAWVQVKDRESEEEVVGWEEYTIDAGETRVNWEIELSHPLDETSELLAILRLSDDRDWPRETAVVTVEDPPEIFEQIGPTLVEADEEAGFNYPYFLYAPRSHGDQEPRPLLIEPNNSGSPSDDFDDHRENADGIMASGPGRSIANGIAAPFLVPVLPRPMGADVLNPQNLWRKYLKGDDSPLARPDLQVLAMADDARERLIESDYPIDEEGIMLNGFSQSGDWVNLFAALHPNEVRSVTAGGVNGMPILPIPEAKDRTLEYHVGVNDLEEVAGKPFDSSAFQELPQFYYMGDIDPNDTLPYFHEDWLVDLAKHVYGVDMQGERFPFARAVYEEVGVTAIFRMYEDTGHTPQPAIDDLVEFHERVLENEDIDGIRADIGGGVPNHRANIQYAPKDPVVGERVAFHAIDSDVFNEEISTVEWDIGQEPPIEAWTFSTAFESPGIKHVTLRVRTDADETYEASEYIPVKESTADQRELDEDDESVRDQDGKTEKDDEEPTEGLDEDDDPLDEDLTKSMDDDDDSIPGFGLGAAISAIGGAVYMVKRRVKHSQDKR